MTNTNTNTTTFVNTGKGFLGTMYLKKGTGCGQDVKFCDAIEWDVPVAFQNKKKVIDQDRFSKILEKHLVDGKELDGHTFEKCQFVGVSFDNLSCYWINFKNCSFEDCSFNNTRFNNSLAVDCVFVNSSFENAVCYMDSKNSMFLHCNFKKVLIAQSRFDDCFFEDCDFSDSYLKNVSFFKVTMSNPDFTVATFNTVYFHGCDVRGAKHDGLVVWFGGSTTQELERHRKAIMTALA